MDSLDLRTHVHETVLGDAELQMARDTGIFPDISFVAAEFISAERLAVVCMIEGANSLVLLLHPNGAVIGSVRLPRRIRWLRVALKPNSVLCVDDEGAVYRLEDLPE